MPEPRGPILRTAFDPHGGPPDAEAGAPVRIDFSVNANPFGPPEPLLERLREVEIGTYPDPGALAVRRVLGEAHGTSAARVAVGAGTADLIHRIAGAYLEPGRSTLVVGPTFGEYARASRLAGAQVVEERAYRPDGTIAIEGVIAAIERVLPSVVWICDPNNPTGTRWTGEQRRRLPRACAEADALLVVDAAYAGLAREGARAAVRGSQDRVPAERATEPSAAQEAAVPDPEHELVLFSPTKAFAIPAVRAGYAIAHEDVASALRRAAPPWMLGAHAAAAFRWCVSDPARAWLRETVPAWMETTQSLDADLRSVGLDPWPSSTPYRLVGMGDAAEVCARARRRGMRLRDATSFGLPAHVRIATRSPEENRVLVDWLREEAAREGAERPCDR